MYAFFINDLKSHFLEVKKFMGGMFVLSFKFEAYHETPLSDRNNSKL